MWGRRYHWSRIQPLSLAAQILYAAIQLPLHRGAKKRSANACGEPAQGSQGSHSAASVRTVAVPPAGGGRELIRHGTVPPSSSGKQSSATRGAACRPPKNIKSKVRKREKTKENKRKQEDSTSILNFFQKTVDRDGLFDYNNTCCFR